jgi:hypothetical protein
LEPSKQLEPSKLVPKLPLAAHQNNYYTSAKLHEIQLRKIILLSRCSKKKYNIKILRTHVMTHIKAIAFGNMHEWV